MWIYDSIYKYINATAINEKRGHIFEREEDEVYGRVWRKKGGD